MCNLYRWWYTGLFITASWTNAMPTSFMELTTSAAMAVVQPVWQSSYPHSQMTWLTSCGNGANGRMKNGYWCKSSGSYHALILAAAEAWGLPVSGCTTSEPQRILDALTEGKLVVAIMSEGHFTTSGHFIVPSRSTRWDKSWWQIIRPATSGANSSGIYPLF